MAASPLELSACTGKQPFGSPVQAERARTRKNKAGKVKFRLTVYRCQFCRSWHIGGDEIGRTNRGVTK